MLKTRARGVKIHRTTCRARTRFSLRVENLRACELGRSLQLVSPLLNALLCCKKSITTDSRLFFSSCTCFLDAVHFLQASYVTRAAPDFVSIGYSDRWNQQVIGQHELGFSQIQTSTNTHTHTYRALVFSVRFSRSPTHCSLW